MRCANRKLAACINAAGLRPPQMVMAVNQLLGEGYLSRSTVSEWMHAGRVPREPLPAIVAQLLSDRLDGHVRAHDLWPHPGVAPVWAVPADHGLTDISNAPNPAKAVASDWVRFANRQAGCDRRRFYPVPNSAFPGKAGGDGEAKAAVADRWGCLAQSIAMEFTQIPSSPPISRFAYRQVLVFAEAVLEAPENHDIAMALATMAFTAERVARAEGDFGLAQRYGAAAVILTGTTASGST